MGIPGKFLSNHRIRINVTLQTSKEALDLLQCLQIGFLLPPEEDRTDVATAHYAQFSLHRNNSKNTNKQFLWCSICMKHTVAEMRVNFNKNSFFAKMLSRSHQLQNPPNRNSGLWNSPKNRLFPRRYLSLSPCWIFSSYSQPHHLSLNSFQLKLRDDNEIRLYFLWLQIWKQNFVSLIILQELWNKLIWNQ